jgi:hypothetical protein
MNVAFDELLHFLDDLTAERSENPDCIDNGILRVVIEELQVSQTSSKYTVVAGWGCLGELRQLTLECGMDFKGNAEPAAMPMAKEAEAKIKEYCEANKIKIRGGRFHGE